MKRILFNRKFGLLDAVLKRHKTQTRRICLDPINPTANKSKWHIGDVVAISQPYKDILSSAYCDKYELDKLTHTKDGVMLCLQKLTSCPITSVLPTSR